MIVRWLHGAVMGLIVVTGCLQSVPRFVHRSDEVPTSDDGLAPGEEHAGIASFYADEFHGRMTSSGERFDMHAMTAAHRTLPFGTMVKVTNLDNHNTVTVRINDRGPFVRGRIIDLSLAAAKALGMMESGTAPVKIESVGSTVVPAYEASPRY